MFTRITVCLILALNSAPGLSGADFAMKVSDKNYLDTQGFSVFLYDSTYHPIFVDQKNTAMEMILHGQRIATNGDVRLMPTPEQWDLVATLKDRHADKANNRLTADLAFPTFDFSYTLEVAAEPGGVKVSINLDKPLPGKMAGRAGFNLEFLPSIYMGKAYLVDGTKAGIFPRTPNDPMTKVLPLPDEPKKAYYLEDWDKAKGYTQPLPFAEGKSITLGVDDAAGPGECSIGYGEPHAVRWARPRAERLVRLAFADPFRQDHWRHRLAHQAGCDSELDAAADDRAQPGRLCAGLLKGSGTRTRPEVQRPEDGQSAAPDGRRILQAGVRRPDHAFNTLAALRLFKIRFHPGEGPRPLYCRVRRPAYGPLPDLKGRLR